MESGGKKEREMEGGVIGGLLAEGRGGVQRLFHAPRKKMYHSDDGGKFYASPASAH